jgi:tetratricopeptide (TPR) repeat protein
MGRKDEAIALYEKSLKTDPDHLPSLYYMAMVDLDRGNNPAAEEKLAKMEKIDPGQPALKELRQRIENARKAK